MIVQNDETGEIFYSTLFVHWLPNNWIDYKQDLRALNLLIYQNKLLIKELGIDEDKYPMEWD
jgi:hypothetical protein